jgi:hypothetical protein
MMPEALSSAKAAYRFAPWNAMVAGQCAALLVRTGDPNAGEALLGQLMDGPNSRNISVGMLFYHLLCDEIEGAGAWFEKAIDERDPTLIPYLRHPLMKPLQSSSRWPMLASKINLPADMGRSA